MVSESIEFVVDFFDQTFSPIITTVEPKDMDRRMIAVRKFCKTLKKNRLERVGNGSVIASVQVYDHLKYTTPCMNAFLNKINEGLIKLFNDKNESTGEIVIIAIGSVDDKPHGWKGSISDFLEICKNHKVDSEMDRSNMNRFYLRDIPKTMIDSERTEFYIFGVVNNNDDEGYDTAFISIVGMPEERFEKMHSKNIREMFGY